MPNSVRTTRQALALSQQDVARQVGLSRQSLAAIESGRSSPSVDAALKLARVLQTSVEALFSDPSTDTVEAELASSSTALPEHSRGRVVMARVKDRWVAHSLPSAWGGGIGIPADGLAAADAIEGAGKQPMVEVQPLRSHHRDTVLILGCAQGLGLLAGHVRNTVDSPRYLALPYSSVAALESLRSGHAHIAGIHLTNEHTGENDLPTIRRKVPGHHYLFNLVHWEAGLVFSQENPKGIQSGADLLRPDVRLLGRDPGSGARQLLERTLRQHGGNPQTMLATAYQARGHFEVAQLIAAGAADVGVSVRAAAEAWGLAFHPLVQESFDLVVPAHHAEDPRIGRLLDVLRTPAFRRDMEHLGSYDVRSAGDLIAEI